VFEQKFNKKITPEFKDLINKMLNPDVTQRISFIQLLEHPWF